MFLWFGEEEHCKHMDSHHRDRSKCSLCVHFVKCVDHHQAVDHHKDYSMRDFAVGCGIGLLVSLTVPSKFVCLFIIFALLILSGDIETNPGPPFALVLDNLSLVLNLVLDVSTKWLDLGLQLGVKERELKCIEQDYGHLGAQTCLREMLSVWLRMLPSWEGLLSSLSHPSVGNPALAVKIRKEVGMPEQDQDQSLTTFGSEQSAVATSVDTVEHSPQTQASAILPSTSKPQYLWMDGDKFEDGYLQAHVGESPIVHFTVESAENAKHILTKDGKATTKRFIVKSNSVKFRNLRLEDSGIYTISCRNDDGLVGEDTIELDVIPTGLIPSMSCHVESAHHHPEASATSHSTSKPKYQWRNEDKFENGFLKVKIGESPVVHFTVESEAPLAGDVQHTLTKDGKAVTKRFMVQNNIVKFKKVRLDDSGKYSISCYSNDVLVCEDTIELEVSPVATSDSAVLATPQQSQKSDGNVEEGKLHPDVLMDLQFILNRNLKAIIKRYGYYVNCLRVILQEKGVSPKELSDHLLSLSAFSAEHRLALIADKDHKLEKAEAIIDVIVFLKKECSSFLDYEIFQEIATKYNIREDREELRYGEYLTAYVNKHKVSEFIQVNPLLKSRDSSEKLTLKLDLQSTYRLAKVVELKESIAEVFKLNLTALQIVDLNKGCIVVTFLIPAHVADILFTTDTEFTPHQVDQFRALSILWIECNNLTFHFRK